MYVLEYNTRTQAYPVVCIKGAVFIFQKCSYIYNNHIILKRPGENWVLQYHYAADVKMFCAPPLCLHVFWPRKSEYKQLGVCFKMYEPFL